MKKTTSFTKHALEQMKERGATRDEVEFAILKGKKERAKGNRIMHRLTLPFNKTWTDKHYTWKQVVPITAEEENEIVVVTVLTFYF